MKEEGKKEEGKGKEKRKTGKKKKFLIVVGMVHFRDKKNKEN